MSHCHGLPGGCPTPCLVLVPLQFAASPVPSSRAHLFGLLLSGLLLGQQLQVKLLLLLLVVFLQLGRGESNGISSGTTPCPPHRPVPAPGTVTGPGSLCHPGQGRRKAPTRAVRAAEEPWARAARRSGSLEPLQTLPNAHPDVYFNGKPLSLERKAGWGGEKEHFGVGKPQFWHGGTPKHP